MDATCSRHEHMALCGEGNQRTDGLPSLRSSEECTQAPSSRDLAFIANVAALSLKAEDLIQAAVTDAVRAVLQTPHLVHEHHATVAREARRATWHHYLLPVVELMKAAVGSFGLSQYDAEDVVQTAFEKLLMADISGKSVESIQKWAWVVAKRSAIDFVRARGRTTKRIIEDLQLASEKASPDLLSIDEECIDEEQRRYIFEQVGSLPNRFSAIMFDRMENLSLEQIAIKRGITIRRVRTLFSQAQNILRHRLVYGPASN